MTVTDREWRLLRVARGRVNAAVPAEPFLYVTCWLATVFVVATPGPAEPSWWPGIGLASFFGYAWVVLMLTSPVQAGVAALIIARGSGRRLVFALWQRLAGDVGLMCALVAFVVARLKFYNFVPPDAALFAHIMLAGVALYASFLVLRDVTALWLMERVASRAP